MNSDASSSQSISLEGSSSDPARPTGGTGDPSLLGQTQGKNLSMASRNVVRGLLGVFLGVLGSLGLLVLEGPRGLLPVVLAFGVLLVLWALERLGVFRQTNGAFCAFGVVTVFAAGAGLSDFAYQRYSGNLKSLAGQGQEVRSPSATEAISGQKAEGIAEVPVREAGNPVGLGAALIPSRADEDPRMAAIQEARRRYPAIWIPGSRENKAFLDATEQLKRTGPELLKEPDWVLRLAESLAREEGWGTAPQPSSAGAVPAPGSAETPAGALGSGENPVSQ